MAACGGVVKLSENSGDDLETLRKPYTTILKDEVVAYGAVRVFGRIGLNSLTKFEEGGVVEELLFKFLQEMIIGNRWKKELGRGGFLPKVISYGDLPVAEWMDVLYDHSAHRRKCPHVGFWWTKARR